MNELELEFHGHFFEKGGLFIPEFDVDWWNDLYKHLLVGFNWERINYGAKGAADLNLPEVNTNYINQTDLNARASAKNNRYFIGINSGAVILLQSLFFRMMANPNVLPHIGNSQEENNETKIFNPQITDFNTLYLSAGDDMIVTPKNNERYQFAVFLTQTAINFLFNHEYAHIALGHVDYMNSRYSQFSFSEKEENLSINTLNSQTLELEADTMAAYMGLKCLNHFNSNKGTVSDHERYYYCDWQNGTFNFAFSVYSMFRLFGYRKLETETLLSFNHPPDGVRQIHIFDTILRFYSDAKTVDLALSICFRAAKSVENAFKQISDSQMTYDSLKFAFSPDVLTHTNMVRRNWNKIREDMGKYSYLPLQPVVTESIDGNKFKDFDFDTVFDQI